MMGAFSVDSLGGYFEGFGSGLFGDVMAYMGYGLIIAIILGSIFLFLYLSKFKIKATVYPLYGSGKDGTFSIGKPKYNSVKWTKGRTAWIKLKPFGNRKQMEPFDSEYIYPGNRVLAFELNGEWIPGRINIKQTEDQLRAEINPIGYDLKNWQAVQIEKYAQEFSKHDFWTENKGAIMMLLTVCACCVLVGCVVYYTYTHVNTIIPYLASLAEKIGGINQVGGTPP